jgi:hypothetical protein
MFYFRLDTDKNVVQMEIELKGEQDSIKMQIDTFDVVKEDEKLFVKIDKIKTNREWMNLAIEDFVKEQKIEIPAKFERLIDVIMDPKGEKS